MILIYWKGKVGNALADLCTFLQIPFELGDDANEYTSFEKYEYIIPSPGIMGTHCIYETWKVLCELDFVYQFLPKWFQIVSITGTDGKSTTSWIMYNILKREYSVKKGVYLSGNFDIPFSATVLDILKKWEKKGIIVLEVSSFMSHMIGKSPKKNNIFHSNYSIFTNFKGDHLNWHKDLQEYLDAKMNLLIHTRGKAILNSQIYEFAQENHLNIPTLENARIYSWGGALRDTTDGERIVISWRKRYLLSETNFSGVHNAMNILSVWLVAHEMKICSKRIRKYLTEIIWLSHRLEKIGEKDGIIFVEDSKSTSSQSLEAALGSYAWTQNKDIHNAHPKASIMHFQGNKNLLLIVGGSDKGDSFDFLAPKFRERVRAMVCIGATKEKFIQIALQENIEYLSSDVLSEGVNWLYEKAKTWDILMLSPWCASFWLFRDYLDRAMRFREAVNEIVKK